ncbi:ABC transporter substrate-binding protein [Motiliproteus sp. MSK22-1]|uniref:substrate-binding periplasmic protein n=1 Tax=Motiliproteus sp. MSK22-1 TaxID=1897630 RepID=UPI000977D171|nr:transporter substrate-binding domain-containing protein [Motiliproteus sp. MSK22-1]OMH25576.1 hypothetical protein BGP75_23780 [Motiliproteus sp. MSK22-1]
MNKILLFLIALMLPSLSQGETIRIATGEFIPYCSSSSKHQGFASHVVSEAFARQGHEVEFDFLPWKRALVQTQNADYDATSWWSYSDERAKDHYYSDELLESRLHFFYVKGLLPDFDWKEVNDLNGFRIGLSRGYYTSDALESARKAGKVKFEIVNDDEQNFRRLLRGRIDIFPINVVTGLELLRTKFAPNVIHQVTYHPRPLSSRPGFLLFPKAGKRSLELMAIFNTGLKSLREDGTYEKMVDDLLSGYYSQ